MKQQPMTILVLEDERSLRAAIKFKLESAGFAVITARTVNQALDYLKECVKVDGIWLDHYLYGKENGLDFVVKLKKNPAWKDLPIFAVSNTVSQDKFEIYQKLGVQKRYVKVDNRLDDITADIKEFLQSKRVKHEST